MEKRIEKLCDTVAKLRAEINAIGPVVGEWQETPTVSGEYWVASMPDRGRSWFVDCVRVAVYQGSVEYRGIGDDKFRNIGDYGGQLRFCGPIPPPAPPTVKKGRK